ncbi:MAG: Holliday junction branch migration protein RuvA [Acidimicrobiales bacterium]
MIGALSGVLAALDTGESSATALVDVAGVGYEVVISTRHGCGIGAVGDPVDLSVHTHVREGAITLYGFANREERRIFELLVSAHGIGPALALGILSAHSPESLVSAIVSGDVDSLCLVPGVGRKTAQRLLVELAGRVGDGLLPARAISSDGISPSAGSELKEALGALGYVPEEIRIAIERVGTEGSVEELLREALSELAPRR